jgi:hypothetical protein
VSLRSKSGQECRGDYFCELLDFAMPWDGGQAALLVAYFDASKRDGGTFCVAGFAFGSDRAKKATADWKRLWGDTQCHMTDLSASPPQGDFKGWTNDQAKERIESAIPIITRTASFGVAVSCDVTELSRVAPTTADPESRVILGGFRLPYAFCCHAAMSALAKLATNADIAYFFETGDDYQGESQAFMGWINSHPRVAKRLYGLRSHTPLGKADARLFETADILAWEWAKHVERDSRGHPLDKNGVTRMRGSLKALLGDKLIKSRETNIISPIRRGWHITGMPLERFYRRVSELELLSDHPSEEALQLMHSYVQGVL